MKSDEIVGVATGLALDGKLRGCQVSKEELALADQPRIFSLQKLVEAEQLLLCQRILSVSERGCFSNLSKAMYVVLSRTFIDVDRMQVADFNMSRMRVVWGRIWRVLSSHFVEAQKKVYLNLPKASFL